MSCQRLPQALGCSCSWYAICHALSRADFKRYIARRKSLITEANQQKRLAVAEAHVGWFLDQWKTISWSDETWLTAGRHTPIWITRRPGEELDPTCIIGREQKKYGWMFWGCFSGLIGPGPRYLPGKGLGPY